MTLGQSSHCTIWGIPSGVGGGSSSEARADYQVGDAPGRQRNSIACIASSIACSSCAACWACRACGGLTYGRSNNLGPMCSLVYKQSSNGLPGWHNHDCTWAAAGTADEHDKTGLSQSMLCGGLTMTKKGSKFSLCKQQRDMTMTPLLRSMFILVYELL